MVPLNQWSAEWRDAVSDDAGYFKSPLAIAELGTELVEMLPPPIDMSRCRVRLFGKVRVQAGGSLYTSDLIAWWENHGRVVIVPLREEDAAMQILGHEAPTQLTPVGNYPWIVCEAE